MNDAMQDREIICMDCQRPFSWTVGEQRFYAEQGFSEPKRCAPCRQAKRARYEGQDQ